MINKEDFTLLYFNYNTLHLIDLLTTVTMQINYD